MAGVTVAIWPASQPRTQGQQRRAARQMPMRLKVVAGRVGRIGRIERQQRKRGIGNRHQRALEAALSATMLAFIPFPFRKPIGSFNHQDQFANQSAMMGHPILIGIRSASPVESRLPRAREDPCLFRTRLNDGDRETIFDSTDMIDSDVELKFDDSQCISVGRTPGKIAAVLRTPALVLESHGRDLDNQVGIAKEFGPYLYSVPADLIGSQESEEVEPVFPRNNNNNNNSIFFATIDDHADTETVNRISINKTSTLLPRLNQQNNDSDTHSAEMETMNMPFWHLPDRRQTKRSHHHHPLYPGEADNTSSILLPEDDISIISDVSLIPTYFPSDIMSNKRKRTHHYHHHRALIKRLIVSKARAARQTVRQLKRTCRDAVGNVFVGESAGVEYRPTKCVQVGAAY